MCGCKTRISGMNTAKIQRQAGGLVQSALKVTAGFAIAKLITSKVDYIAGNEEKDIKANPILAIAVPFIGALVAGNMLPKGIGPQIAVGMGVAGAVNAVQQLAPTVAGEIGLAGPMQVTYPGTFVMPGVAGYGSGYSGVSGYGDAVVE